MAKIGSKVIFVTTSPRTPEKMIPEIQLLNTHFADKEWNNENQIAFVNFAVTICFSKLFNLKNKETVIRFLRKKENKRSVRRGCWLHTTNFHSL
jgi:hypothetical protein